MPRKSRRKTIKKEPEKLTVRCPVRGHKHTLEYIESPDRPDLLVAYCGDRQVAQRANPEVHKLLDGDPPPATTSYRVPSYSDGEGE